MNRPQPVGRSRLWPFKAKVGDAEGCRMETGEWRDTQAPSDLMNRATAPVWVPGPPPLGPSSPSGGWGNTPTGRVVRVLIACCLAAGIVAGCIFVFSGGSNQTANDVVREIVAGKCYNFGDSFAVLDGPAIRPGEPTKRLLITNGECGALHTVEVAGQLGAEAYFQDSNRNANDCIGKARSRVRGSPQVPMSTAVVAFRFVTGRSKKVYCLLQFTPAIQGRFLEPETS